MTRERRRALEARVIADRKRRAEPALFTHVMHTKGASWRSAPRPHVEKTPVDAYPKHKARTT